MPRIGVFLSEQRLHRWFMLGSGADPQSPKRQIPVLM